MIVPATPRVNAIQQEKVRGARLPGVPKLPAIPAIGVSGAPRMPRYASFRAPRTVGAIKTPRVP
jgi:hypothetical protein